MLRRVHTLQASPAVQAEGRDLAFDQIGRDVRVKRNVIHRRLRNPRSPGLVEKIQEVFQLAWFSKQFVSRVELTIPDRPRAPLLSLLLQRRPTDIRYSHRCGMLNFA